MFRKLANEGSLHNVISLRIDDQRIEAENGEPLAAVMLRNPPFTSRMTPVTGAPRAPYCMMGACFDCLVEVDGAPSTRSCLVRVREGMAVRRQDGRPAPLWSSEA